MAKPPKIKSGFAILDVLSLKERTALHRQLDSMPIGCTIKGKIVRVHGNHDGTSQEYEIEVETVETFEIETVTS